MSFGIKETLAAATAMTFLGTSSSIEKKNLEPRALPMEIIVPAWEKPHEKFCKASRTSTEDIWNGQCWVHDSFSI